MEQLENILLSEGINPRPSYYSGRGATTSDLTAQKLITIQEKIKNAYGDEAERNFVEMVKEIPVMSATSFLITLFRLVRGKWVFNERMVDEEGISMDGMGSAFGTFASVLGGRERDETHQIKFPFLLHNGVRPEEQYYKGPDGMTYRLY